MSACEHPTFTVTPVPASLGSPLAFQIGPDGFWEGSIVHVEIYRCNHCPYSHERQTKIPTPGQTKGPR